MNTADVNVWSPLQIKADPIRFIGILVHLLLRTLFAIFWLAAGINKIVSDWLTSGIMNDIFVHRLTELPPDSFAVFYLQNFAIPLALPVAWAVTIAEIYSAIGLLFGFTTRLSAIVALFILFNFSIGGYYDASLIPFFLLTIMFIYYPSGHWFGIDKYLSGKYPDNRLFR